MQAIKYLNEQDVIDECYGIQKELAEHNDHQAKKYFETYLLNIKDGTYNENFRKASLRYLDIKKDIPILADVLLHVVRYLLLYFHTTLLHYFYYNTS